MLLYMHNVASQVHSQLPKCIHNSIDTQLLYLKHEHCQCHFFNTYSYMYKKNYYIVGTHKCTITPIDKYKYPALAYTTPVNSVFRVL